MSARDDGGPAFPARHTEHLHGGVSITAHHGMSLRDYLAAKAIQMATKWEEERPTGPYSAHMQPTYEGIATRAYLMADAMLKARTA